MSFSGGTFSINTTGQPVVDGTTISTSVFNALTADLATGLSTCMLKDGTQTATAGIGFYAGTVSLPGIYFGTDTATGFYRIGLNNTGFSINGTKLLDLSSANMALTGLMDISAATSGQIKFPGTQNASANVNTLDDYEEGTWTPAWGGTGSGAVAGTTAVGWYTKIGNVVQGGFIIDSCASVAGFTGDLLITGLPFTATSTGSHYGAVAMGNYANVTLSASYTQLMGVIVPSATHISLYQGGSAQAQDPLPVGGFAINSLVIGTIAYHT